MSDPTLEALLAQQQEKGAAVKALKTQVCVCSCEFVDGGVVSLRTLADALRCCCGNVKAPIFLSLNFVVFTHSFSLLLGVGLQHILGNRYS